MKRVLFWRGWGVFFGRNRDSCHANIEELPACQPDLEGANLRVLTSRSGFVSTSRISSNNLSWGNSRFSSGNRTQPEAGLVLMSEAASIELRSKNYIKWPMENQRRTQPKWDCITASSTSWQEITGRCWTKQLCECSSLHFAVRKRWQFSGYLTMVSTCLYHLIL